MNEENTTERVETERPSYDETVPMQEPEVARDLTNEGVAVPSDYNIRGVSINPLSSGYMVKVGCQSVAVETTDKLLDMLGKYLNDPQGFEKKWFSKDVRNRLENI